MYFMLLYIGINLSSMKFVGLIEFEIRIIVWRIVGMKRIDFSLYLFVYVCAFMWLIRDLYIMLRLWIKWKCSFWHKTLLSTVTLNDVEAMKDREIRGRLHPPSYMLSSFLRYERKRNYSLKINFIYVIHSTIMRKLWD